MKYEFTNLLPHLKKILKGKKKNLGGFPQGNPRVGGGGGGAGVNYGTRPLFLNSAIEPPRAQVSGLRVLFMPLSFFPAELRTKSLTKLWSRPDLTGEWNYDSLCFLSTLWSRPPRSDRGMKLDLEKIMISGPRFGENYDLGVPNLGRIIIFGS